MKLHYFSYSHLQRLHDYLRELGKEDLIETISLVGYSPLRNACLVAAHILNKDIAVSIDDDCLFIEPEYIGRIKSKMLSEFEGKPIRAYCGPYITAKDTIYLDLADRSSRGVLECRGGHERSIQEVHCRVARHEGSPVRHHGQYCRAPRLLYPRPA